MLVIRPTGKRHNNGQRIWLCKCDCGNYKNVNQSDLLGGKTKSCRCLQGKLLKMRNKKDAEQITDNFLKRIICIHNPQVKGQNIPKEIIKIKQAHIKLKRKLKECQTTI